jgi:hypothetical protein
MRGGLVPREQQQEHHRHHLAAADLSAFLFNAHKLRDKPFAAILAHSIQVALQIALHGEHVRNEAQEADSACQAREAAGPGRKLRPVGKRQAEELANHRKRQLPRVAVDEVGRASRCEQFACKLVSDRVDARLHVEDGATAEGLVDNIPQPPVIRLVHRQHVVGEGAQDARHPPSESGDDAIVAPQGERFAVLQDPIGQVLRCRRPHLSDNRELHLDHRACRSQLRDRGGGIAKIALTRKVCAHASSLHLPTASASGRCRG